MISPDVACPDFELSAAWVAADFELVEPSAVFLVVVADVVSEAAQLVVAFAADASVADVA